jgi:hypothetical protein
MNNLSNSTQVVTLFLDALLGVRRLMPATARLMLRRAHDLPNKRFADQQQAFVSDGAWLRAGLVGSDPR